MWSSKEKWLGDNVCLYLSGKSPLNRKIPCFGFAAEITTTRIELFIGFFGFIITW